MKEYRSKVDWWMYLVPSLPLVGGGAAVLAGLATDIVAASPRHRIDGERVIVK